MNNILVRFASHSDSRFIFEWRNDDYSRLMSHSNERISWNQHQTWFSQSLNSKSRMIMICENDITELIGMLRFDILKDNALISINLNPSMRGKGYAKNCLNSAIDFFSSYAPSCHNLIAEIKEENFVSIRLFLNAGFHKIKVMNNVGIYQKKLILD